MQALARIARLASLLGLALIPAVAEAQPVTTTANVAIGVVSTGYDASATSIVLTSGHGARFGSTFPVRAVWYNFTDYPGGINASGTTDPNLEYIEITARSTDTLTVTRAIEGPSASIKNTAGKTYWIVAVPVTAASWNAVLASLGASPQGLQTTSSPSFTGLTVDTTTLKVDNTNDRVGIGIAAPEVSLHGQNASGAFLVSLDSFAANTALRQRRGNGTASAITRAASGEALGNFQFWPAFKDDAASGAVFSASNATFRAVMRENATTTGRGTRFEFQPTAVGATAVATAATIDSDGIDVASGHSLSVGHDTFSTTFANGLHFSQSSTGVADIRNNNAAKFRFDPTQGSRGQMQWFSSVEARPHMQLEDAIAAGGTDHTDTRLSLFGRSGAGAVANFFTAQVNMGAIDGTSAATSYGWITDGTWTNGGGFGSNTKWILFDQIGNKHLITHNQSDTDALWFFDDSAGSLKVGGTASRGTTDGTNQLVLFNGTAPVGTLTNGASMYSASGEAVAMDSAGNPSNLTAPFTSTVQGIVPASGGGTSNFLRADGSWATPSGGGNVSGPGSSTDNAITRFDGTGGTTIQNSGSTLDDNGLLTLPSGGLARIGGTGAWSTTQPTNAVTTYSGTAPAGTCTDCVTYYNGSDGIPRVRDEGGVISVLKELSTANTSDTVANAADTYMAGTALTIGPVQKAGTILKWNFGCTKTAAGTATPTYSVRFGTNGTTADTARLTFTGSAQTAATDTAFIEIRVVVRSIGASATVAGLQDLTHVNSTTGFSANETDTETATSGTFDNTSTSLIAGVSINPGASGVWTCQVVTGEARNLQ